MSPTSKSLKIIIPKNATVKKIFFNKFDLVLSINPLKKYAKGIKLTNQRTELVCNPNRSQAIPKKNQKVMYMMREKSSGLENFL